MANEPRMTPSGKVIVNVQELEGYDAPIRVTLGHGEIDISQFIKFDNPKPSEDSVEEKNDDEIIEMIKDRFEILEESTRAVLENRIRSFIVSGAQGVGKSETIIQTLGIDEKGEYDSDRICFIKGKIASAYQLYILLLENKDKLVVLDDCDTILKDPSALNILKAALETGDKPRVIQYRSKTLEDNGEPTSFEFKGNMIFITNENFQKIFDEDRGNNAKHFKAFLDRSLYLDLKIRTPREIFLRIRQIIRDDNQFLKDCPDDHRRQIEEWLLENINEIRFLSLRTALHLSEMIKGYPGNWQKVARMFLTK